MGRERDLNLVSNNTGMRRKEILIMRLNKLLSPGKIGTLELKNRFVVPPMGTNCGSSNGCYNLRLRFIEQPIVFSFAIRYNKGIEFVSKLALHLHVFGIYESLPIIL